MRASVEPAFILAEDCRFRLFRIDSRGKCVFSSRVRYQRTVLPSLGLTREIEGRGKPQPHVRATSIGGCSRSSSRDVAISRNTAEELSKHGLRPRVRCNHANRINSHCTKTIGAFG